MSNVLIPCGGRWVGLIVQMKEALRAVDALRRGRLIVADRDAFNPAGFFADGSCVVPEASHPLYVERLLELCRRQEIRVLVPHLDLDLDALVPHLERFAALGVAVVCPQPELVELCRDKRRFETFAAQEGLPFPRSYSREELHPERFPLFAKRSCGSASEGAGVCRSLAEAQTLLARWPDLIFQDLCEDVEVSVDAFISVRGCCTVRVPRLRQRVIGGEAVQSRTFRDPALHALADQTIAALAKKGYRGPLNVQMFAGAIPTLIEVNARLGSACVLSNRATQGRFFRSVLEEACGGVAEGDPDDYREGLHLTRYWGEVYHDETAAVSFSPPRGE